MGIQANCPNCGASYNLAPAMAGKQVRCKSCQDTFVVHAGNGKAE